MLVSNKRYSLKHDGICANTFTFPKWGKGDRAAVDEDVRKLCGEILIILT